MAKTKTITKLENAQAIIREYGLSCEDFGSDEIVRFRDGLAAFDDDRHQSYVRHRLADVIVIAFLATLADADDWQKMWIFAKSKQEWLTNMLGLEHGIPSHDTIQNVISIIDSQALSAACIYFLMEKIDAYSEMARHDDPFKKPDVPITSIDGKTSRGSAGADTGNGETRALHTLNAYSSDYGCCIGQVFVPDKTNEIPAVPDLLDLLDVSGCVVTWDALNTQKKNVAAVIGKGGDYVAALKANHQELRGEVKDYFDDASLLDGNPLVERSETKEKEHNAIVTRKYAFSREVNWIYDRKSWEGLRAIGRVTTTTSPLNGKEASTETRYYLSSLTDAGLFARSVRQHWAVEALHWHMDVTFRDDANTTRDRKGAQNLQIMKKAALALLKLVQPMYKFGLKNIRYSLSLDFEGEIEKIFSYLDVDKVKAELIGKGILK